MIPLDHVKATENDLMENTHLHNMDLRAILYQTGYLTIKSYDKLANLYTLGFPNQEVRQAFLESLVKEFSDIYPILSSEHLVR